MKVTFSDQAGRSFFIDRTMAFFPSPFFWISGIGKFFLFFCSLFLLKSVPIIPPLFGAAVPASLKCVRDLLCFPDV